MRDTLRLSERGIRLTRSGALRSGSEPNKHSLRDDSASGLAGNGRPRSTSSLIMAAAVHAASVCIPAFQPSAAVAQQSTENYSYDALGRLIKVEEAGGQNDGEMRSICYDSAGNRTELRASSDGSVANCVLAESAVAPMSEASSSGPPASIQITDDGLNVLPAHQATYYCAKGSSYGYSWAYCHLSAGSVQVYNMHGSPQLDPGYTMTGGMRLEVDPDSYGTGVSP